MSVILKERYEALRWQAIENVDRRHGYTMEFSSYPKGHAAEYDEEESRLHAEDPGALICPTTHENRAHPLGAGMFVCFKCWATLLLGGTSK